MTTPERAARRAKIAAVVAVAALLIVAQRLGLWRQFADPALAKQTLVGLGAWGYVAFVATYAALQPFGVPGTVFIFAAPLVWPWPTAFALSMVGTMGASVVGFSFARFVARDWISARIPEKFRKYDEALETRAFATVFFLRLVFWMPPLLHAFFGVSKVRFSTHFWASAAGYLAPLLLVSVFGAQLFELVKRAPLAVLIGIGVAIVALVASSWIAQRRAGRVSKP